MGFNPCSSAFICGQTCAAHGTAQRRNYRRKPKGSPRPIFHLTRTGLSPQCLRLRHGENVTGFAKVPLGGYALDELGLGQFQELNGLLPSDGGKVTQKIVESIALFQVIDQGLNRNARAGETSRIVHDSGVHRNHFGKTGFCAAVTTASREAGSVGAMPIFAPR